MSNIIDYINWRGDLDFDASPFNDVDNLILASLAFINFARVLGQDSTGSIKELTAKYEAAKENYHQPLFLHKPSEEMLKAMATSNRFANLKISHLVDILDPEIEMQFAAMTIEIDPDTAYISYRGTDNKAMSWREDFRMAYKDHVPSHTSAVKYLNKVGQSTTYKNLYVGGHSKGGNLALYASVHADPSVKKRIIKVFSNDGPGVTKQVLESESYKEIVDRMVLIAPHYSMIGMLLNHNEEIKIVESNESHLKQHSAFSWQVQGTDFVTMPSLHDDALLFERTIKEMLEQTTIDQQKAFFSTLVDIFTYEDGETINNFTQSGLKGFQSASRNYRLLDSETKELFNTIMSQFIGTRVRKYIENNTRQEGRTHRGSKKYVTLPKDKH